MTTDTVGGVWTFTQELVAGLLQQGCSIKLVSLGRALSSAQQRWVDSACSAAGGNLSFDSLETALEWMEDNDRAYTEAAPLLLNFVRDFQADLLHSNQFCFGALPLSIPKLVTAHSDVLSWADGCRDGVLADTPWLQRYRALVGAGLDGADCVTAPTQWMLGALQRHFRAPSNARVIANGRTLPVKDHAAERKLQAVTAGRLWDEAKNLQLLRQVRSPIPLVVAGEAEFASSSVRNEEFAGVSFLGALSSEDLIALFRGSAIYLCTSVYEPFGLAPLEAALAGCAVLAHDLPSLREVWGDGALFFAGAEDLSALLVRLGNEPAALAEAQARSTARARFYSAERMTDRYHELFRELSSRGRELGHVA